MDKLEAPIYTDGSWSWDFFYRTYNKDKNKMYSPKNERVVRIQLDPETSIADAIVAALASGMSKGSFQSGCYEVHCNKGIWSRPDGKSITHNPSKAILKTWEQP